MQSLVKTCSMAKTSKTDVWCNSHHGQGTPRWGSRGRTAFMWVISWRSIRAEVTACVVQRAYYQEYVICKVSIREIPHTDHGLGYFIKFRGPRSSKLRYRNIQNRRVGKKMLQECGTDEREPRWAYIHISMLEIFVSLFLSHTYIPYL